MCGIAGFFHKDHEHPVDRRHLAAMAAIQWHRGPDGFGIEEMPGIGFAHARLSIIDIGDSGRQPLRSADDSFMLTHNGEFYDYQRIRARLTASGERFHTKSDSEIVLPLFRRYGLEGMLEQLRGEFAFALYDRKNDQLILVRDRFGIKPLYWTVSNDTLVFGSEIKSIFAFPGVERSFTPEGLFHQLMQTMPPGTTPYRGVHQVKPGYALLISRKQKSFSIREVKYWDAEFPEDGGHNTLSERENVDSLRESLLDAVQTRLVADVPVGCYLSGGIDSCSILGLASACRQDPVKAFTIGFDSDAYDESAIAREMALSVDADQDLMMLNADSLYDHFVKTHWHTERTIYNTLAVAKYLMSKHVHENGYRVVVTGEGSDELLSGYPAFRRDMFLHGLKHLSSAERKAMELELTGKNALFRGAMLAETEIENDALNAKCGFTPSSLQPWLAAALQVPPLLSADLRNELKDYSPGAAIAEGLDREMMKGRHPLDIAQYVWIKTMLEGQILTWGGDRVDMANSMEARPAFLDHHFAKTAMHIPPRFRIKGTTEKYVLREAMKGLLPRTLYERSKFAFMAPPAHSDPRKMEAMKSLAAEYLCDEAIHKNSLLDSSGIRDLMKRHEDENTPPATLVQMDTLINHLLGVQILQRDLIERDIPALAQKTAAERGWDAVDG